MLIVLLGLWGSAAALYAMMVLSVAKSARRQRKPLPDYRGKVEKGTTR
jgi:hypothetical protein